MALDRPFRWLWLGALCASAAGCASRAAPAAHPAPAGMTSVAARDASGDLIVAGGAAAADLEMPRWLASLETGDVLVFTIASKEDQPLRVEYSVSRMERRYAGVAALFVPLSGGVDHESLVPYWLAGDEEALFRLDRHPQLIDPGFTPLDAQGRVINEARSSARRQVPQGWDGVRPTESDGWVVQELSMKLEGQVRGDRCAEVIQEASKTRVVVCGDVGIVELNVGGDLQMGERWELVEIKR